MKYIGIISHRVGRLIALAAAAAALSAALLAQSLYVRFVDADPACPMWPAAGAPYELAQPPNPASSLELFVNGVLWAAGEDFALNGAIVTLLDSNTGYCVAEVVELTRTSVSSAPKGNRILCVALENSKPIGASTFERVAEYGKVANRNPANSTNPKTA